MISIKSYLKTGTSLIIAEQFSERITDPEYIEGAIELVVNDVEILDLGLVDYIDQFWCYLIEGSAKLSAGESFVTYLPDQPIELMLKPLNSYQVKVAVSIEGSIRVAIAEKRELISALEDNSRKFFDILSDLVPGNADYYKKVIDTKNFTYLH